MQIGEVAARTELSLRTIRHYEETGLVIPSARSQGGFRLYGERDVERLMVIRRMKPLGFTLDQMRDLLEITDRLDAPEGVPDAERAALLDRLREYERAAARTRAGTADPAEPSRGLRRDPSHPAAKGPVCRLTAAFTALRGRRHRRVHPVPLRSAAGAHQLGQQASSEGGLRCRSGAYRALCPRVGLIRVWRSRHGSGRWRGAARVRPGQCPSRSVGCAATTGGRRGNSRWIPPRARSVR